MPRRKDPSKEPLYECSFRLEESVFLMLQTGYASYTFAGWLNRLFRLGLTRQSDIFYPIRGKGTFTVCPLYLYHDELNRLYYILIDNPTQDSIDHSVSTYDKILAIVGDNAARIMSQMYADLSEAASRAIPVEDVREQRYDNLRMAFINGGIIDVAYYDFLHPDDDLMQQASVVEEPPLRRPQQPSNQLSIEYGYSLPADKETYNALSGQVPQRSGKRYLSLDDDWDDNPSTPKSSSRKRRTSSVRLPQTAMHFEDIPPALYQQRIKALTSISRVSQNMLIEVEHHLSVPDEELQPRDLREVWL